MASGVPTVAALAEAVGLSRAHLYRRLRAETGEGPAAFARGVRLDAARTALERGAPVGGAATATGYDDRAHFARAFRRRFGVAPSGIVPGATPAPS